MSSNTSLLKNNHNKSNSWNQQKLNTKNHEKKSENNIFRLFLEICQIQAELFYMLTWKQDHEIFAIIIKNIEKAFELKSYVNSWSIVFEEYHDLIDVFKKQNADELSSHQEEYNMILKNFNDKITLITYMIIIKLWFDKHVKYIELYVHNLKNKYDIILEFK